jgi:hypothetical protein
LSASHIFDQVGIALPDEQDLASPERYSIELRVSPSVRSEAVTANDGNRMLVEVVIKAVVLITDLSG